MAPGPSPEAVSERLLDGRRGLKIGYGTKRLESLSELSWSRQRELRSSKSFKHFIKCKLDMIINMSILNYINRNYIE